MATVGSSEGPEAEGVALKTVCKNNALHLQYIEMPPCLFEKSAVIRGFGLAAPSTKPTASHPTAARKYNDVKTLAFCNSLLYNDSQDTGYFRLIDSLNRPTKENDMNRLFIELSVN